MDIKRVAAVIAECDDEQELAEVLAEVYRMLLPGNQATFRAAIEPKPDRITRPLWDENRLRDQTRHDHEQAIAEHRQREETRADRLRQALEATSSSGTVRSPEERAELQARLERLQQL